MIEVKDLCAGYGKLEIIHDVEMHADAKELVTILGPNGSGKSTLVKSIFRIATIHSGSITYDRVDLTRLATHEIARRGVVYVPQRAGVFGDLTVRENLNMALYFSKSAHEEKIRRVTTIIPAIADKMQRKAVSLSGGEKQMLAIAMALLREPTIIFLDEPTASLSPKIAQNVLGMLKDIRDTLGIAVVFVEQNAIGALEIADRAYFLLNGRVNLQGTAAEFRSNPKLSKMFLGLETTPAS